MTARRIPIPITFFVVVAPVIFLIIFFGAWAVSADVSDRSRSLSFGFVAGTTATNATTLNAAQTGSVEGDHGEDAGDSWWGSAFLKACPFH